ncbi:MAG: TIGR00341 family protein [Bacteroidota bacterium]|nr:TIGR00341 family protein [Bacteroidota bacterium]
MAGQENSMNDSFRKVVILLRKYFNIRTDREQESDTIEEITKGVNFRGSNLWILIFAIFLASLGLNVNSTAVIIGAMLISPLMGPIVGMGLAVGIRDFYLLKRSFRNYLTATIISVITATIYFLISPFSQAQSELLARTTPTLYDVLIALFGGAAGIMALCTKGKGNVIPGVAIATALMPPLCTAGFGIASGNIGYFLGAFYLFFINTVFIALATFLGVKLLHFQHKQVLDPVKRKKVTKYILYIVVITMIPAVFMTLNILSKSIFNSNVSNFVNKEIKQTGTQIISYDANKNDSTLKVVAVGKEIADTSIRKAQSRMQYYKLQDYQLQIIQGTNSSNISLLKDELLTSNASNVNYTQLIAQDKENIANLQKQLSIYTKYDTLSKDLQQETRTLFPKIKTLALTNASETDIETQQTERTPIAIVTLKNNQNMSKEERTRFVTWLQARTKTENMKVFVQ